MYIDAYYLDASTFWVRGNWATQYPEGLRLVLHQGLNGDRNGDVITAVYNGSQSRTEVTVLLDDSSDVRTTLYRVSLGPAFVSQTGQTGNVPKHYHRYPWDGGVLAAASFTEELLANLAYLPLLAEFPNNALLGVTANASDFEPKVLQGVSNRTTVEHGVGTITVSIPQDFHTAASPTLAGLTLTGFSGLVKAVGGVLSGLSGTIGQILYHNGTSFTVLATLSNNRKPPILRMVGGLPVWVIPDLMKWTGEWNSAFNYYLGDVATSLGRPFVCTLAHVPTSGDEPGIGPYWADYWEPVVPEDTVVWRGAWDEVAYMRGDQVSNSSSLYISKQYHVGTTGDEPGVGPYWVDYWELMI